MKIVRYLSITAGCLGLLTACTKNYENVDIGGNTGIVKYPVSWNAVADSSSMSLVNNFWNNGGHYFNNTNDGDLTFNYWPQAHALDVLVDAYERTQAATYSTYISQWYDGVKQKNGNSFLNNYYDDMEWNALAMLRAFNATGDTKFKDAVMTLWTDIQTGWNSIEGGGIGWRKTQTYYKNMPANGPACILAARLYRQFNNPDDLNWAKKIYQWVKDSLYEVGTGLVYDGINAQNDGVRNTSWKFTYNQGTFIGAALELYKATGEPVYLNDAVKTAGYTIDNNSFTTADRILKDEGGGDGGLFKGIFIRYFTQLILQPDLPDANRQKFLTYFKNNAETLWYAGTNKSLVLYGSYWKTPPGNATELTIQLSGSMLMEAMALLKSKNLL